MQYPHSTSSHETAMIEPIMVQKLSLLDQPYKWFNSIVCLDTRNLLLFIGWSIKGDGLKYQPMNKHINW